MAINISKKIVAAHNKKKTTPKTPDKAIPFIDRMTVGIVFKPDKVSEEIQSNIWTQVADKETFGQVTKSTGYNAAWRIKLASAVKIKHFPVMQYRYADGCAARLSLTMSPHDLGEAGLYELHAILVSLVPHGWAFFVENGSVNKLETSVDLPGVEIGGLHILPKQTTTVTTWASTGKLETVLLGKKHGNQTRIYDRRQKRLSKKQAWQLGAMTRIERVLRKQNFSLNSLADLENQFSGINMVALPPAPPPHEPKGKEYVWHLFCDAIAVRGLPTALKLLPADTYRKRYRAWLAQHPQPWWQPDAIWSEWKPMIETSRLTATEWV